jgi:predicted  nucleic acid-binding Zn-ribbon protein
MKTLLALVALCLALPLSGRAQNSDSLNIAGDQATSMNKLDDLMGRAQKRLSYIMTNLGDLSDNNDTNNNFDKFKENLDDLDSIRSDIKDRAERVRELQGQRMAAWTKEVSGMTDKDMRKLTGDQIDAANADFDALNKKMREVGGDANDLTILLKDLKNYFASSFSPDSVKTAQPMVQKALASAQEMLKDTDALRDAISKSKQKVKGTSSGT